MVLTRILLPSILALSTMSSTVNASVNSVQDDGNAPIIYTRCIEMKVRSRESVQQNWTEWRAVKRDWKVEIDISGKRISISTNPAPMVYYIRKTLDNPSRYNSQGVDAEGNWSAIFSCFDMHKRSCMVQLLEVTDPGDAPSDSFLVVKYPNEEIIYALRD